MNNNNNNNNNNSLNGISQNFNLVTLLKRQSYLSITELIDINFYFINMTHEVKQLS